MKKINEDKYYELMLGFRDMKTKKEIKKAWRKCFVFAMQEMNPHISKKACLDIFNGFRMENWQDLHKINTRYKHATMPQLLDFFSGDCSYISDRISYDRLFRAHWLFLRYYEGY